MNAALKEFYSKALIAKELEGKIRNLEECKLEEATLEEMMEYESPVCPELQILKLKWEGFLTPRDKDTPDDGQSLEELQCILEKKKVKLSASKYKNENMKKKLLEIRASCKELREDIKMSRESVVRDKDFLFVTSVRYKESLLPSLEVHSRSVAALEEELKRFQTEAERVKEVHQELVRTHHEGQCLKKLIKKKQENVDDLQSSKSVLESTIGETKANVAKHTQELQKQNEEYVLLSEDNKYTSCVTRFRKMHRQMVEEMEPVIWSLRGSFEVANPHPSLTSYSSSSSSSQEDLVPDNFTAENNKLPPPDAEIMIDYEEISVIELSD